jgi:hypothetical protein
VQLGSGDVLGPKTGGEKTRQKDDSGDSDYGQMPRFTSQHEWCSLWNRRGRVRFRNVPASNFDNAMFYMNGHSVRKGATVTTGILGQFTVDEFYRCGLFCGVYLCI